MINNWCNLLIFPLIKRLQYISESLKNITIKAFNCNVSVLSTYSSAFLYIQMFLSELVSKFQPIILKAEFTKYFYRGWPQGANQCFFQGWEKPRFF